ncbi:MAG: TetR/AcrR family transcriptional regulator [Ignavibacteriales bacterium]|nr:TetR/AcrR family transcriptional regulator [Ignavibacteriales bacterium]MBI3787601.1 TetR/AcrR family transcriptional regulator [Ignavibacteriales bacterium]
MSTDLELRDRILFFARDRFMQAGFSKVTLDEIATDLGISKKTLYKFFSSKEDLLKAAVLATMKGIEQSVARIASSNKPFAEKLAEVMVVFGKNFGKIGKTMQADLPKYAPELWKEIEKFRREKIITKLAVMIKQAREEKIFREDVNEDVLIHMLIYSIQGILNPEILSQNSFSAPEAFHTIFKVLFEGTLTDEARKNFHLFDTPITNLQP